MSGVESPRLTEGEKLTLLRIARDTLAARLDGREPAALDTYPLSPALRDQRGAFVTLHDARGGLRGCIGSIQTKKSLAETVRANAVNAGFKDPRFAPLRPAELAGLHIEISALFPSETPGSPFFRVTTPEEIVIGRDGLYLEHTVSGQGGLLLPQVPVEQGWDVASFLEHLCMKAGLPPGSWRSPACRLWRFGAEVFSEDA